MKMVRVRIQRSRKWWTVAGCGLCIVVLLAALVPLTRPAPSVAQSATIKTASLLSTIKELQQSFGPMGNPGKITKNYLSYMNRLVSDCKDINTYKAPADDQVTTSRLVNSRALCSDVTQLATNSIAIYSTTQPLLLANPSLKRYQKIPPIKNHIRQQQLKATQTATQQVSDHIRTMEYPTHVLALLNQLQANIKQSKDLAYFPALRTFQYQLLAERQQYWTGYADMSRLIKTLQSQLDGYCQDLAPANTKLGVCPKN